MDTWIEKFNDDQIQEIHALMQQEWWCNNRSVNEVEAVIAGSNINLAALDQNQQIAAFARVLTDGVFKAVLFDVIVRADCRGSGLGERLLDKLKQHKILKNVKSLELYCPDRISGFYLKSGFEISDSKLHRFSHS